MSLLVPLFLAAGALVGVPILLHFLRSKPRVEVIFPTLQFLGASAARETNTHRLRRWLTLLMRCLIILLICLAFSRPYWGSSHLGQGTAVIIAIDNSFSMQARGRWDELRPWAAGYLTSLKPGDQAGILLMNPAPRWLVPLTQNVDQVRQTLNVLQPGYETTHYDAALRLASDALMHSGARQMTLVWTGDGQRLGWQGVNFGQSLPTGVNLKTPPIPDSPRRQAAITKARWENMSSLPTLQVTIAQFIPNHDRRVLTVTAGDKVLYHQEIALDAGQDNNVLVPLPGLPRDQAEGVILELNPDDLPVDDVFYAVHEPAVQTQVFITPDESEPNAFDFLSHAIDSSRQVAAAPLKAETVPESDWPAHAAVLVRGSKPFDPPLVDRLDRFLKTGGAAWIFLNGSPSQDAWLKQQHLSVRAMTAQSDDGLLHLRNWDTAHPILVPLADSLISLLGVEFYKGFSVEGVDAIPLATWDDGSCAIAEVSREGQHFLVSGFELDRTTTNWPVEASFVPFVHSAVMWLTHQQSVAEDIRVDDTISLPAEGSWDAVTTPRAQPTLKVSGSISATIPGLYRYHHNAQDHFYAINVRPEESDLTPWPTPEDFLALSSTASPESKPRIASFSPTADDAENQQRVWGWLLASAFILILIELGVANRTSI